MANRMQCVSAEFVQGGLMLVRNAAITCKLYQVVPQMFHNGALFEGQPLFQIGRLGLRLKTDLLQRRSLVMRSVKKQLVACTACMLIIIC